MQIISEEPLIQARYERMVLAGTSATLAEMFAFQQPPGCVTDRELMFGQGEQFAKTPALGDYYRRQAARHGLTSVKGLKYHSGAASFPGDPEAWTDNRGDLKRVLEKRGWGSEGIVKTKLHVEEPQRIGLDESLVQEEVNDIIETIPEADRPAVKRADLAEKVRNLRKPHWARK